MNFRVSQKLLAQCIQRNHRLLTIQQNINKCGVAHYSVNIYPKKEYNPSCSPFSKRLLRKDVSRVPLYMNFQKRNISDEDLIKKVQITKEKTPPVVEEKESTLSEDAFLPDYITDMYKDPDLLLNMVQFPDVLLELSKSKPVEFAQELILTLHNDTGLPWWATFAVTAVFIRTFFLLPLGANQMRLKSKLQRMQEYMTAYKTKLREEHKEFSRHYKWPKDMLTEEFTNKVKNEARAQYKIYKIHPNKVQYLIMIEMFVWGVTSLAIRNLCHALPPSVSATELYKDLSFGGVNWITDLTLPDQFLVLPFLFIFANTFIIDAYKSFNEYSHKLQLKHLSLHLLNILMIPVVVSATSGVAVFWATNSICGVLQIYLLHTPIALRLLRAKPLKSPKSYDFYYDLRRTQKQIKST